MQTLAPAGPRQATRRSPFLDLLLAVAFGFLAALAKRHLDWSLGIPGHAGVGWIAVLVVGSLVNPRRGMALAAGASMAVWGVPIGLGHSLGYNAFLYGSSAAALEAALLLRVPLGRWWGAAAACAAVHIVKYGYVFIQAWFSGIVRNVEIYGLLAALRNHVVFGVIGGVAGWALFVMGRRIVAARRHREP